MRGRGQKYNAVKTIVDGHLFDSKKEAARYQELKLLQRAGKITDLRLQVPFELVPACSVVAYEGNKLTTKKIRAVHYVADFTYIDPVRGYIVEDVKGVRTAEYKLKKKLMAYKYKIWIKET